MKIPDVLEDETQRLQALYALEILDTPAEERFERLTRLAQFMFDVPIAVISLVDAKRQWFKSQQGLSACETARDISFCGHGILQNALFEIPDTLCDPRFADNPMVIGGPKIRFYAGLPLVSQGYNIGMLCIKDVRPNKLNTEQKKALQDLANLVIDELNAAERVKKHTTLIASEQLTSIIARSQETFILEADRRTAFNHLLSDILKLTASEYGFLGEVLYSDANAPYLKTYAITNIAWDKNTRAFYNEHAPKGMEFTNLNTLFGAALTTEKPVIANTPNQDTRRGGLPNGHPPMNAFLGLPIHHGGKLVAMLGLANREGGYEQSLIDFLSPLLTTIGQLVVAAQLQVRHMADQQTLLRLSRVASQSTNGVVVTDCNGDVLWINDGFTRLSGYTLPQMIGKKPGELLQGPLTDQHTVATMRQALNKQQAFSVEVINYSAKKIPYWVKIQCNPLYDECNKLEGFMAIQTDISENKNNQEQLQLQLNAFTTLNTIASFASSDINEQLRRALHLGATQLGLDIGIISEINNTDYKIKAFIAPEEIALSNEQHFLLGNTYCDLTLKSNDVIAITHMSTSKYKTHPCYALFELESYIGIALDIAGQRCGTLSFSSSAVRQSPFSDSDILFVRLLARWIAAVLERQQSSQILKTSELRLRGLFELSPMGIALTDYSSGRFIDVNQALLHTTGYSRDEFVALSNNQLTPQEYAQQDKQHHDTLQKTGRFGPYEKELICKNGSRYPVLLNGMVVHDNSRQRLIWTIIEDISERKRVERLQNEFISTVSHELRTPLTAIEGVTGLLMGGTVPEMPDKALRMLQIAHANCKRLGHLVNDLLDIEKLIAGKVDMHITSLALLPLLHEAIKTNQSYADKYAVTLILDKFPCDLWIKADGARLQQVFANLLSNAAKFSPHRGEVLISAQRQGSNVKIAVRDFGPGIDPAFYAHIFEKFSQADGSPTRQKGGTGLGLAISKELVKRMNGDIGFASTLGEGATFFINLPIVNK